MSILISSHSSFSFRNLNTIVLIHWSTTPTHVIPHACDATPSHAHYIFHSCLTYYTLTHRANTRYSSCLWYDTITRTSYCSFLFEIKYVDPPYQNRLFLMLVMPHYYTHIILFIPVSNTLRWPTALTHVISHVMNTLTHSQYSLPYVQTPNL